MAAGGTCQDLHEFKGHFGYDFPVAGIPEFCCEAGVRSKLISAVAVSPPLAT